MSPTFSGVHPSRVPPGLDRHDRSPGWTAGITRPDDREGMTRDDVDAIHLEARVRLDELVRLVRSSRAVVEASRTSTLEARARNRASWDLEAARQTRVQLGEQREVLEHLKHDWFLVGRGTPDTPAHPSDDDTSDGS